MAVKNAAAEHFLVETGGLNPAPYGDSRMLGRYRAQLDAILPLYETAHQCGTLRVRHDPALPVVNSDCRSHDIENLYVIDTSIFVSSAAVNPALSAIANSLRVVDSIRAA